MQRISSSVPPVKVTMAERVWLQLAAEIVSGGVAEGRRLDEVEQSQRLGVSRTPLRESLRQLAALGLVENRPHRGVVVAEKVGDSVFLVLAELEAACARATAAVLDDEQRVTLAGLPLEDDVVTSWLRQACDNSVLRGLLTTLWYPITAGVSPGVGALTQKALAALREAVVAGDLAAAERAARHYVSVWRDLVLVSPA